MQIRDLRRALRCAASDGVRGRSVRVALVIGAALNLINQGEAIVGANPVNWPKLLLAFAMPNIVSTYGAVALQMATQRSDLKNAQQLPEKP